MRKKIFVRLLSVLLVIMSLTMVGCGNLNSDDSDKKPEHTITFETNGGSEIIAITDSEGKVIDLETPTKEGCVFIGWYSDSELTQECTLTVMPGKDIILYAKWGKISDYQDNADSYLEFFDNGYGYTVKGVKSKDIVIAIIPSEYKGKDVLSVEDGAFLRCQELKSVIIGENVTTIGDSAFCDCVNLTSVEIPYGIKSIKGRTFIRCGNLTNIKIPDGVTSIGEYAFSGCSGLTSIKIPDSVTSIGHSAFSGCSGITSIKIPDNVTSIGSFAFSSCINLEKIIVDVNNTKYRSEENCLIEKESDKLVTGCNNSIVPSSVKSIASSAFGGSGITSIEIPDNVTKIGISVFDKCVRLEKISVDIHNTKYRSEGNCLIEKASGELIAGCNNSIIPNSVKVIGISAFSGSGIKSIEIPDSVTIIGKYAFSGCQELKSVIIGENVTTIGDSAFCDCVNLTSVKIGKGVTCIEYDVLKGCIALKTIVIPENVTTIQNMAFYKSSNLTIYCEADKKPDGWDFAWNFSNCPVHWGYKADT